MSNKFPLECLPKSSLIRTYSEHFDQHSESPLQYHFSSIICGISVILNRKVCYDLGHTTLYPNLYLLIVGESGMTRKSSSTRPIFKILRKMNPDFILSSSISTESLIPSFNRQPVRLLFLDEMKMLFDLASKNYGTGIIGTLTHLHECPTEIKSDFKKDFSKDGDRLESSIAKFPYLSLMGLTTQEWMNVSHSDVVGGFIGRFLPIISIGETQKIIPFPENDEVFFDHISAKIKMISGIRGKFKFSEATKSMWIKKYTEIMSEVHASKNDRYASFGGRLGDTLIKLCMLISASMPVCHMDITEEVFESASILTDYFKKSYLTLLGDLTDSKFSNDQRRLKLIIQKHGGRIDHSSLLSASGMRSPELKEHVSNMVEKGILVAMRIETGTKARTDYFLAELFKFNGDSSVIYDQNGLEIAKRYDR